MRTSLVMDADAEAAVVALRLGVLVPALAAVLLLVVMVVWWLILYEMI
jgi:hypothetical protein